jgi:hypothetical protein
MVENENPFQGPYNYLELLHGQNLLFVPARWEFGTYTFTTKGSVKKTVQGVRMFLSQRGIAQYRGMPYIDIGQQKLMYQLRPLLGGTLPDMFEYSVTAYGSAPVTEYQLSVRQLA